MKKIAALIVMAALFAGTLAAYDVSWGGWVDHRGALVQQDQADFEDDDKKAGMAMGSTNTELTINVAGENFGFTSTLGRWNGEGAAKGAGEKPFDIMHTYMYSNFNENITLYAGYAMWPISYSPASAVEGWYLFNWDTSTNDSFGTGMGAYNYQRNGDYNAAVDGVIIEGNFDALSVAAVLRTPTSTQDVWEETSPGNWEITGQTTSNTGLAENWLASSTEYNVKYALDVATIYAGVSLKQDVSVDDEGEEVRDANTGLFFAAALNVVEGLQSDIKVEIANKKEAEDSTQNIALNLGYTLDALSIASETNIALMHKDSNVAEATMAWDTAILVTPFNVPVVNLGLNIKLAGRNGEDSDKAMVYGFGVEASKSFGNLTNRFGVAYESSTQEDPIKQIKAGYKITMWF